MLQLLQNGTALYLLVAICLIGLVSKLAANNSYKRMIKESNNMAMTKNKYLRNLKQKAEDAYRINQGIVNTEVYLEKQLFNAKIGGNNASGLDCVLQSDDMAVFIDRRGAFIPFLLVPL